MYSLEFFGVQDGPNPSATPSRMTRSRATSIVEGCLNLGKDVGGGEQASPTKRARGTASKRATPKKATPKKTMTRKTVEKKSLKETQESRTVAHEQQPPSRKKLPVCLLSLFI